MRSFLFSRKNGGIKYPNGNEAEFIVAEDGMGIKFTISDSNSTILHIGENGVTVNDTPVSLAE